MDDLYGLLFMVALSFLFAVASLVLTEFFGPLIAGSTCGIAGVVLGVKMADTQRGNEPHKDNTND